MPRIAPVVIAATAAALLYGVAGPAATAAAIGPVPFPSATGSAPELERGAWPPASGDFDADGIDDLISFQRPSVLDPPAGANFIAWGEADRSPFIVPLNHDGFHRAYTGDFNGDGVGDVFWTPYWFDGEVNVWYGSAGTGAFTGHVGPFMPWARPIIGDFDGSGTDDVYLFNSRGPDGLLYGLWSGGFASVPASVDGLFDVEVGDYDGDGADDIVWYDRQTGEGTLWWGGPTFVGAPFMPGGGFFLRSGDFDGDGRSDLLFLHGGRLLEGGWSPGTGQVFIWFGSPDRGFTSTSAIQGRTDYWMCVGDYDGNGQDDILFLISGSGPNYVWLFRPWAQDAFEPYDAPAGPLGCGVVADLDGDGSDDILFDVTQPNRVVWYGIPPGG